VNHLMNPLSLASAAKTLVKPLAITAAFATAFAAHAATTTTTFESGQEGWEGPQGIGGSSQIVPDGNPGNAYQTVFNNFGITFSNTTNPAFVGDYTQYESITISIDVRVDYLNFFGTDVSRSWLLDLRNQTAAQGSDYPWFSTFFVFDTISQAQNSNWTTFSVTFDPNSESLPTGWGGYGAEDPNTFEPILPPGQTFASILSDVTEIAFTTFEPGYFYGFSDHTILIDNITITTTTGSTCPSCAADFDANGGVDGADIAAFIADFETGAACADVDANGGVDGADLAFFIAVYEAGGC